MQHPPPGLAYCPNCGGHGHTGECESEPGKLYDCYICGNSGFVPEVYAAEWNADMDERSDIDELSHLEEMQDWIRSENETRGFRFLREWLEGDSYGF